MTDSIVIEQAVEGDPDAWTQLVEKHTPMVMGLAVRYTRNGQDAQDIVQETFLKCYARLAQLRDPARFAGWLRRIALNVCHMRHRQRKRVQWVPLDESTTRGLIAYEHTLMHPRSQPLVMDATPLHSQVEAREIVYRAFHTLSETLRTTAMLYYLDGRSYREIAETLRVPLGTVKRRLHDARQKMQQEIVYMTQETIVLKHAVGLETHNETHTPLFGQGMHLPAACTFNLSTAEDNQAVINFTVLQGDSRQARECRTIGEFEMNGITPGQPRQTPEIKITFAIDTAGQFSCRARELPDNVLTNTGHASPIDTAVEMG